MNLRAAIPSPVRARLRVMRDNHQLSGRQRFPVDAAAAQRVGDVDLAAIMADYRDSPVWTRVQDRLQALGLDHQAEGVNPGDRRALSALVAARRPLSILEVGTHIGSSTATLVATLIESGAEDWSLTTCDFLDVNDPVTRRWEQFSAPDSPAGLIRSMGVEDRVRFVTSDSKRFLREDTGSYDLIFLDGDHAAATVYVEVPLALRRLREGGVILLHDFYPGLKLLWPDDSLVPGPFLAMDRLEREGSGIRAQPLGELPWPTKQGKNITSLAIVQRA